MAAHGTQDQRGLSSGRELSRTTRQISDSIAEVWATTIDFELPRNVAVGVRSFFLRLGLIGDDFPETREHLLKRLRGLEARPPRSNINR